MEFRLLGPLDVIEQGRSLALGGVKQRSLLAVAPGYILRVDPSELDLARFEQLLGEATRAAPTTAAQSCDARWNSGAGRRWRTLPTNTASIPILRITGSTPPGTGLPSNFQGAVVDRVVQVPASLVD